MSQHDVGVGCAFFVDPRPRCNCVSAQRLQTKWPSSLSHQLFATCAQLRVQEFAARQHDHTLVGTAPHYRHSICRILLRSRCTHPWTEIRTNSLPVDVTRFHKGNGNAAFAQGCGLLRNRVRKVPRRDGAGPTTAFVAPRSSHYPRTQQTPPKTNISALVHARRHVYHHTATFNADI